MESRIQPLDDTVLPVTAPVIRLSIKFHVVMVFIYHHGQGHLERWAGGGTKAGVQLQTHNGMCIFKSII